MVQVGLRLLDIESLSIRSPEIRMAVRCACGEWLDELADCPNCELEQKKRNKGGKNDE